MKIKLPTLLIATILLSTKAYSQPNLKQEYLKENSTTLVNSDFPAKSAFDEQFYNSQFIILSERHGYGGPQLVDGSLYIHLNKTKGIKNYIAEIDFVQAIFLNKYLQTGDTLMLQKLYDHWFKNLMQWGCRTGYNKWQRIYAHNKTVAKKNKINVIGVDQMQDTANTIQYLQTLAKGKKGNIYIDSLLDIKPTDTLKKGARFLRRMAKNIDTIAAQKLLKKNYSTFMYILCYINNVGGRENTIYNNFKTLTAALYQKKEQCYGFFGRFHAMQDSINGDLSFVARLKKDGLTVNSINAYCTESSSMLPTSFLPPMAQQKGTIFSNSSMVNDDSFVYKVSGIAELKAVTQPNTTTLFKLNGINSPYTTGQELVNSKSDFDKTFNWRGAANASTIDFIQYIVLIRNSDWAVPYGNNKVEHK